jgi:hypothetical protein
VYPSLESRDGATCPGPPLKFLNFLLLLTVLYEGSCKFLYLASQVLVFGPPKIFCLRLLRQNKFLLSDMKLFHFFMCLETRVYEKEDCRLMRALLKVYVLQQKLIILLQTFGHIRLRTCHVNFLLNFNF